MESLKIRSSISSELKSKTLFKGTFLGAIGAILIMYAGSNLPQIVLQRWGWLFYAVAFGLITLGLLPYRALTVLEHKPNELLFNQDQTLTFYSKTKKKVTIPANSIQSIFFSGNSKPYGIALTLKNPVPDKIIIHDPYFNILDFEKKSQIHHCDLFFPYFSERAYQKLSDIIDQKNNDYT